MYKNSTGKKIIGLHCFFKLDLKKMKFQIIDYHYIYIVVKKSPMPPMFTYRD